jgi:hypothetical protein
MRHYQRIGAAADDDASWRWLRRIALGFFALVAAAAIALAIAALATRSGGVSSVGATVPSFLALAGSPITSVGSLDVTLASQAPNTVFAAPDGAPGAPDFRLLGLPDLPSPGTDALYWIDGSGTLTTAALNVTLDLPFYDILLVTEPNYWFSGTLEPQLPNNVLAGPAVGPPAAPTFRTLGLGDLAGLGLTTDTLLTGVTAAAPTAKALTAGPGITITSNATDLVVSTVAAERLDYAIRTAAGPFGINAPIVFESSASLATMAGITYNTATGIATVVSNGNYEVSWTLRDTVAHPNEYYLLSQAPLASFSLLATLATADASQTHSKSVVVALSALEEVRLVARINTFTAVDQSTYTFPGGFLSAGFVDCQLTFRFINPLPGK